MLGHDNEESYVLIRGSRASGSRKRTPDEGTAVALITLFALGLHVSSIWRNEAEFLILGTAAAALLVRGCDGSHYEKNEREVVHIADNKLTLGEVSSKGAVGTNRRFRHRDAFERRRRAFPGLGTASIKPQRTTFRVIAPGATGRWAEQTSPSVCDDYPVGGTDATRVEFFGTRLHALDSLRITVGGGTPTFVVRRRIASQRQEPLG